MAKTDAPQRAKSFEFDGHAVGMQIVERVKQYVREATEPLETRIATLERDLQAERAKGLLHYDGIWTEAKQYDAGALTTWNGSMWLCTKHTTARPGTDPSAWKLTAKRGGT